MSKKSEQKPTWRRTMHYYWAEIKKYKGHSLLLFVTTPLVVFGRDIFGPIVFADILEKLASPDPSNLIADLLPLVLTYFAVYVFISMVVSEIRLWATWKMELLAMRDLSELCFDTISAQSLQFHSNRFSGSLVSQTNKFVGGFERMMDSFVWNFWYMFWVFLLTFIVLLPQVPLFAIGLLAFVVIYTIVCAATYHKNGELNEAEAAASNKATGQLADAVSNIAAVKSYAHETHEARRYSGFLERWLDKSFRLMRGTIKRDYAFMLINSGIIALVLIFMMGGRTWFGLSIATIVLIVNYSQRVMGELWDINHLFKDVNRVFGDAKEMTEILDLKDDVVDLPGATRLEVSRAAIDFDDITFKHSDAKVPVFHDFSLEVKPGERIGLVGVSGSGKTTLTKLLLRFADVNQGKITIDGQDIKHITQASLRKNIAYVPQETALFHRSISDNIAYGKPDATAAEIKHAARLANADEFIKDLPNGYDTLVGERGIKLSGGQRQRIAIARAILKDAPILVLDEATSALDSESEALIQGALKELIKDRTSIVIAHRLSTVMDLDRIVVLENGKIVETGSHAELLEKGGAYARLWSRQSGAFLDEN